MSDRLFRLRSPYLRLWSAASISSLGARISREGIPLTAVLTLHAAPGAIGVLAALGAAPAVATGLLGGPWVDRGGRRGLMIAADLVRAALLASIPVAAAFHVLSLTVLCVVAALVGAGRTLFDMASHAFLPSIVPQARLVDANAGLSASDSAAEIAGPGVTGLLVTLLTAPIAMAVNVATYLASALCLACIPGEAAVSSGQADETDRPDILGGLRIAWREPSVRALLAMTANQALAGGVFSALYILFAIRTLALTPLMLGITIAVGGAGSLIGAALTPWMARRLGMGPAIPLSAWATAACLVLIPLAGGGPFLAMGVLMVAQLLGDASGTASEILMVSCRQGLLPASTLGRTAGAFAATEGVARTIGALAGGLIGETLGLRAALAVAAGGFLLAPLWTLGSPLWRSGTPRRQSA